MIKLSEAVDDIIIDFQTSMFVDFQSRRSHLLDGRE